MRRQVSERSRGCGSAGRATSQACMHIPGAISADRLKYTATIRCGDRAVTPVACDKCHKLCVSRIAEPGGCASAASPRSRICPGRPRIRCRLGARSRCRRTMPGGRPIRPIGGIGHPNQAIRPLAVDARWRSVSLGPASAAPGDRSGYRGDEGRPWCVAFRGSSACASPPSNAPPCRHASKDMPSDRDGSTRHQGERGLALPPARKPSSMAPPTRHSGRPPPGAPRSPWTADERSGGRRLPRGSDG